MIVSGEGHIVCGRCRNCMAGRRHLCPYTSGVGVNRPGAFAEYIVIPNANVWHHADGIDLDIASIFDPFGNATHTALQWDMVGEDVLITGAGPIGAMAAAVARHAGARHVVITDVNDYRLDLAKKLGATRTVNVAQREARRRAEGARHDRGLRRRPRNVRQPAARSATCSTTWPMAARSRCSASPTGEIAIDWNKVIFNMLTIKGIYGREIFETWYKMTVMIQSGLDLSPIITHRLPYQEFESGFEAMLQGGTGKVVLNWDDDPHETLSAG